MRSIEKTGKKTEDAINAGLKELGCDLADVTIDILDAGSPGLFGMFGRLAKVRLTVKEEDPDLEFDMPTLSLDRQKSKPEKKERKAEEPKQEKSPRPEKKAEKPAPKAEAPAAETVEDIQPEVKPAARPPKAEKPRREQPVRAEKAEEAELSAPAEPQTPFTPSDPATLSEEGRLAYDFLKNVTEKMGVSIDIMVTQDEDHLNVSMMGDTRGILIGRRGDTLDALQYLTSLEVNKHRDGYLRVSLDTENYRARREEALTKLALRMAGKARKTGHKVTLEPMNPYERRILHSALQSSPYVTTHSEGEEPYRRVIITLKGREDDA